MVKSVTALLIALYMGVLAAAATHEYDWTLGWKTVNPDGLKDRLVVAINDQWPLPVVRVSKGDRIIARVTNGLDKPKRNSTIHWHGMFQNGTTDMDGASWLSQCPGAPNTTFVYNFTVDQNGTYWYHAHVDNLYPDGYRQILLVDDDEPWFKNKVDEELSFTMSDWYHELTQDIADDEFMSLYNPTGAEPIPDSLLLNDTIGAKFHVKPSTTYRLRIANTGAFSAFIFYIQGHNFTIVEADGVYCEPAEASSISVAAAQRYSVLFTTGPETNTSYQMVQVADSSLYDIIPPTLVLNQTSWLVTSDDAETTEVTDKDIHDSGLVNDDVDVADMTSDDLGYYDDSTLVPYDREPLLKDPTQKIVVEVSLTNLYNGINYAFFNDISWTHAKVPTLYSVLSAPDDETANNATIYGTDTHTYVLDHNEVVQLVVNNFDSGSHPFHLHGHAFQVALRAESKGSDDDSDYFPYNPDDHEPFRDPPMRRDVLVVKPYSHFVLRWRADNPGVWFFHCHIDWHLTQGLAMEFVEAPAQIRQNLKVPESSYDTCSQSKVPFKGNAAANTKDFMNLSGQNMQEKDLPKGFTARGIVALVFSVICAFVGMGFLAWYGLSDTTTGEIKTAERILHEPVPDDIQSVQFDNGHHHGTELVD